MADAVLQIEFDRNRVAAFTDPGSYSPENNAVWKAHKLLVQALYDTLENGGTFVVQVDDDTITAVQRDDTPSQEAGDA